MELVSGSVADQAEQTLENLQAIVEESGGTLADVLKTTVYLDDLEDYDALNQVYGEYFDDDPPARVCLEVARLPNDIVVEIEAIARID